MGGAQSHRAATNCNSSGIGAPGAPYGSYHARVGLQISCVSGGGWGTKPPELLSIAIRVGLAKRLGTSVCISGTCPSKSSVEWIARQKRYAQNLWSLFEEESRQQVCRTMSSKRNRVCADSTYFRDLEISITEYFVLLGESIENLWLI